MVFGVEVGTLAGTKNISQDHQKVILVSRHLFAEKRCASFNLHSDTVFDACAHVVF